MRMTPLVVYTYYNGMDRGGRISSHIRCKIVLRRPKGYFMFVQNDKHSVLLFSFILYIVLIVNFCLVFSVYCHVDREVCDFLCGISLLSILIHVYHLSLHSLEF